MHISRLLAIALAVCFSAISYAANPQVELKTNLGNIVIELYPDKAPKTVDNFLRYVKDGHYRNTVFHRVIPGFMIQGGQLREDNVGLDAFNEMAEYFTRKLAVE